MASVSSLDSEDVDLQRRFALLEADRRAFEQTSSAEIADNQAKIDELKAQNAELQSALLQMQRMAGTRNDTNVARQTQISRAQQQILTIRKKIDKVQHQLSTSREKTDTVEDEINIVARHLRAVDTPSPAEQKISTLENELASAQVRREEAATVHAFYERIHSALKTEAVTFGRAIQRLKDQLSAAENDLAELRVITQTAASAADQARDELDLVRTQIEEERQRRSDELDGKRQELKATLIHVRERAATATTAAAAAAAAAVTARNEHRSTPPPPPPQVEEASADFTAIFDSLIEVTGASGMEEIFKKFEAQESSRERLERMGASAQDRINQANAEYQRLEAELASDKAPQLSEMMQSEQDATVRLNQALEEERAATAALADARAAIQHIISITACVTMPPDIDTKPLPTATAAELLDIVSVRMKQLALVASQAVPDELNELVDVSDMEGDALNDDALWDAGMPAPVAINDAPAEKNAADPAQTLSRVQDQREMTVLGRDDLKRASTIIVTTLASQNKERQ